MIAKIVKGSGFNGVVKYVIDSKKETQIIDSNGVRLKDRGTIIQSFITQAALNTNLNKTVGHISLDFSVQDKEKLTNKLMKEIAREYMKAMGIVNTQYIVGRHHDKEHPHIHIVFNRVDCNGKTISDSNERLKNEKVCKKLTEQYNLYFAKGKENVKEHRLKEPDRSKYEIYNTLKQIIPQCKSWKDFMNAVNREGINITFMYRGSTSDIQGIKFSKNGYHFNGSKVDRSFSYSQIKKQLQENRNIHNAKAKASATNKISQRDSSDQPNGKSNDKESINYGNNIEKRLCTSKDSGSSIGSLIDILIPNNLSEDPEEEAFINRMKRKKRKGIRR